MLDPNVTLLRLRSTLQINKIIFETEEINGGLNGKFNFICVYDHTGKNLLLRMHIADDGELGLCLRVENVIENQLIDYACDSKYYTYTSVFNWIIKLILKLDKKITGEKSMSKYRVKSVVLNNDRSIATAEIEVSPRVISGTNPRDLALTIHRDIDAIGTPKSVNYVDYSKFTVNSGQVVDIGIKDVIFNPPATIVNWADGTKTVVKCQNNETFDPEKGLALCFMKKINGNQSNFNNIFKKWIPKTKVNIVDWRDVYGTSCGYVDCGSSLESMVITITQYMSIREAAKKANLNASTLSRIKNGTMRKIKATTMDKIWNLFMEVNSES